MALNMFRSALAGALAIAAASQATATTLVIPSAYTSTKGTANANIPFGAAGATSYAMQIDYAASLLSAIPIGSVITAIGFRLYPRYPVTDALNYSSFDISVGQATTAPSQMTRSFAANQGADTVLVRSGPLSIAANTLVGSKSVNPFFTIDFTTPYTYTGGNLLFTIRDVSTTGVVVPLDAYANDPNTVNTLSKLSSTASTGDLNAMYVPIMQLTYSAPAAVPEPASWALMIGGFGAVGGAVRRERGRRSVQRA